MDPVIIFMTDGDSNSNDVSQSEIILKTIFSNNKNGMFFAIGFGSGYERKVLE